MQSGMNGPIVTSAYRQKTGETRLTEADIRRLIPAFYAKLRNDPTLGPVFEDAIGRNWEAHIETVCSFWLHVTGLDRRYDTRNFIRAHLRRPAIRAELLPLWLSHFRETAGELCTPSQADALTDIARRMAETLEISLGKRDGEARDPIG